MATYLRSRYLLPAELEDDLVADLWQVGTLGVQSTPHQEPAPIDLVCVEAWFEGRHEGEVRDLPLLGELESRWRPRGLEALGTEAIPESDWLTLWRRGARPIPAGERLLLDPREPETAGQGSAEEADTAGRFLLRLPARRAFGTGSHETTRLTLRLLEDACCGDHEPPVRILDVGTGTGVLSFAALLFGVPRVIAYDVDAVAVFLARGNARLNRFGVDPSRPRPPRFFIGTSAALGVDAGDPAGFDLVLLNVLPHLVDDELPGLLQAVAPGGAVVVAGMLTEEGEAIRGRYSALGFYAVAERREGAWVAYRFERADR